MKTASVIAFAFLFATSAPTYAQTGPAGTWRVEVPDNPAGWEVFLSTDGPNLNGMVSSCAPQRAEIYDGDLDGTAITFKCNRRTGQRLVFTGRLNGDEITFAWQLLGEGPTPVEGNKMFGPLAPAQFTAKRVPDGELANAFKTNEVEGVEFAAAVNLLPQDLKVDGRLFLPLKVMRVRAIIVVSEWGLGKVFALDHQVRRMLESTESGLLLTRFSRMRSIEAVPNPVNAAEAETVALLLQRLAQESMHGELADAPLLFWGHSAGSPRGTIFDPERVIALITHHGGFGEDVKTLSRMPALLIAGGRDTGVSPKDVQAAWMLGRSIGGPWTFAVDPDAGHGDYGSANDLVIPWITAVLRQRLSPDGPTLRPVSDNSALLGNNQTGEFAPYGTFSGSKPEASWIPDLTTAQGWRAVAGQEK